MQSLDPFGQSEAIQLAEQELQSLADRGKLDAFLRKSEFDQGQALWEAVVARQVRSKTALHRDHIIDVGAQWEAELADAVAAKYHQPNGDHITLAHIQSEWTGFVQRYYEDVERSYPLDYLLVQAPNNLKKLQLEKQILLERNPRDYLPQIQGQGRGPILDLPRERVAFSWEPELGTGVLQSAGHPEGQPHSPYFVFFHGAGTTSSHAGSWAKIIAFMAEKIFGTQKSPANVAAPDGLHAGTGPRNITEPNLSLWTVNAQIVAEHFLARQEGYLAWFAQKHGVALEELDEKALRAHWDEKTAIREQYIEGGQTGEGVRGSGLGRGEYDVRDLQARFQRILDTFHFTESNIRARFTELGYITPREE